MRAVVYDATDTSPDPELKDAWRTGAHIYKALGRFDRILGAASWNHALSWLRGLGKVDEVQFWGHGSPGRVWCAGQALDVERLEGVDVRDHFWFRTCASFAGPGGHQFASDAAAALGCTVAAHTYNIGLWQSGLVTLSPGERPHWSVKDGFDREGRVRWSTPWAKRTVTCLESHIPRGW